MRAPQKGRRRGADTASFHASPDAGLRHLPPGIMHMPKGVSDSVGLPVPPHHVLLEFHWVLGSSSGPIQFVQGHVALQAKGTPRLLQEICLEHTDHALIHRLRQGRSVRRQKDKLDVGVEVLQHLGVSGGIVQDHQDLEGEALRQAIFLQLAKSYVLLYSWNIWPVIQPLELEYQWMGRLFFS